MTTYALSSIAAALMAPHKGILAADESVPTMTKRLEAVGTQSTPSTRLAFRELLITTQDIEEHISGVILHDETIRQVLSDGARVPDALAGRGILPGIKVDTGAKPLAGAPGEHVTEGLDGLRQRLAEYRELGARFAKWRAIFAIGDRLPSRYCIDVNAHALARYAALCQEAGLVPIVEPEVLMDGEHRLEDSERVTTQVLHAVFDELHRQRVAREHVLLKPNMVLPGTSSGQAASMDDVAAATLRTLRTAVPAAVPGIAFLSGGQDDRLATAHLAAINSRPPQPWELGFSYGRALQARALAAWRGDAANVAEAQSLFAQRVRCTGAARDGEPVGRRDAQLVM